MVERARYEATRAERRYRSVDPENRLVARGIEREWEQRLHDLAAAEAELEHEERRRPRSLTEEQRRALRALGSDVRRVWSAATTTDRDRKELLRTLVEEVIIDVRKAEHQATATVRWRGGTLTTVPVALRRVNFGPLRTDEDTAELVCRLAARHSDRMVAAILNRQGRTTAHGVPFTSSHVRGLRRRHGIPPHQPSAETATAETATMMDAAKLFGVVPSTIWRWIKEGFVVGEQITPGAPWRIRITDDIRARVVDRAPEGYVHMTEAIRRLGGTRMAVMQQVKEGQLEACYVIVCRHRSGGMWIKVPDPQPILFPIPAAHGV